MNLSYHNRYNLGIKLNFHLKEQLVCNMAPLSNRIYFRIKMQFSISLIPLQHPIWDSAF